MPVILIFCHIWQKGIFFTFCFVIYFLLTVYFSKYLQFPLNTITYFQNYVNEYIFLEDNGPWKCKLFIFAIFFFSTLEDFSEKTYEKTCRFYNIFSKYNSNCARLPRFTIWIFLSKICWPFPFLCPFFSLSTTFARKLMKRPINFMTYFQTSYLYVHAHKILWSEIFFQKYGGPFKKC